MSQIFALIDCNNFFVSCERLFRPDLEGKPVVVLSSNDGCAVARSNEAKKLGIPMGAPAFKYRQIFADNNVKTFSANFEIYGNISRRITTLLSTITPRIEIYSVDESFLGLSGLPIKDYGEWGREIKQIIMRHVGVPVSIGIAPTKTLAKLGAEIAKQHDEYGGAVDLVNMENTQRDAVLAKFPLRDIWGIGRQVAPKLRAEGISTALDLANLRPQRAQQLLGIHGRKLVAELNGTECHQLELTGRVAKSLMRGRTFGEDTSEAHVLEAAIAALGAQAAFALRREGLLARRIGLYINTNRHKPGYRSWTPEIKLDMPTNDSGQIISLLVKKLQTIFNPQQQYHRLGVFMHDFVPEDALQTDLLGQVDVRTSALSAARMQAVDKINSKWGRGKIHYAAEGLADSWQPKHQIRSPRYVSNWNELPTARIQKTG